MCNITTTCIIFIFFLLWLIHQFFFLLLLSGSNLEYFLLGSNLCITNTVLKCCAISLNNILCKIFTVWKWRFKKKIIYIVEQEKTILNQSYQKLKEKKTVLDTKWWGLVFFLRLAFQLRCLETPLIVIQAGTTVVYPHVNNT